jgi:hypothetical protein
VRATLVIAANDLKRVFHEKSALFWIFGGPLLFTAFFGVLFTARPESRASVDLVAHERAEVLARALGVALELDGIEVRPVAAVAPGRFVIEIPEGADAAFSGSKLPKLVLHSPEEQETNLERRYVFKTAKALTLILLQANPADLAADTDAETIRKRLDQNRSIGSSARSSTSSGAT